MRVYCLFDGQCEFRKLWHSRINLVKKQRVFPVCTFNGECNQKSWEFHFENGRKTVGPIGKKAIVVEVSG